MINKLKKDEKGAALLLAVLSLVILSILITGLFATVINAHTLSISERRFQSTYYISEAANKFYTEKFQKAVLEIYDDTTDIGDTDSTPFFNGIRAYLNDSTTGFPQEYVDYDEAYGIDPKAEVDIEMGAVANDEAIFTITSKGKMDGSTRVTVSKLKIQWIPKEPFDWGVEMALFTNAEIDISNGSIVGDIGTNGTEEDAVNVPSGWPEINGNIHLLEGAGVSGPNEWNYNGDEIRLEEPIIFEFPPVPEEIPSFPILPDDGSKIHNGHIDLHSSNLGGNGYHIDLNGDVYIPSIKIRGNETLTINQGDDRISIVVGSIDIEGKIKFVGQGKMTMYLSDTIKMNAGSSINAPDNMSSAAERKEHVDKLAVYYSGSSRIVSVDEGGGNDEQIFASLYAYNEDVEIFAKGSSGFQGHIVSKGNLVQLDGAGNLSPGLIYAPNAHVSMTEGANVTGAVIANTFEMDGGGSLDFDEDVFLDNPFAELPTDINDLISDKIAIREK